MNLRPLSLVALVLGCGPAGVEATGGTGSAEEASGTASLDSTAVDRGVASSAVTSSSDGAFDTGTTGAGQPTTSGSLGSSSSGSETSTEGSRPAPKAAYVEVAVALGIDVVHQSESSFATQGQAWGDFDRDGDLDLVLTSQLAPNHLFRGVKGVNFEAVEWGAEGLTHAQSVTTGAVFVDYDNDFWPDLYLLAWGPNSMLRNNQGQGFIDATSVSGLGDLGFGETAAWADYDGDGLLDVYIANNDTERPDRLLRNEGGGAFSDTGSMLDAEVRSRLAFSATFFDYDLDGDPDLYVGNDKSQGNVLWRNDGPGCGSWCFANVSDESDAGVGMLSMGLAVGDYDNDGDQDIFVSDLGPMVLLNNQTAQGVPGFVEVAEAAGALVDEELWMQYGWGAQFVDYDNDGWLDLYVALGRISSGPSRPNVMLRNRGDGTFQRLDDAAGAEDGGTSQGLATADFDEDGAVDLVVGNKNGPFSLFRNQGAPGRWLELELHGDGETVSTDAAGARVSVTDDAGRTQTRELIVGSSLGAGSALRLHFGFGDATPVSMTIRWPDGTLETWDDVPVNELHTVEF